MDDLQHEDLPIWDSSDEEVVGSSELDREWQRRHDQFHTVIRLIVGFLFLLSISPMHMIKWLCNLFTFNSWTF